MIQSSRAQRVLAAVLAEQSRQRMSDLELSRRWGVSRDWLQRRFSGKAGLTISELGHLARALDVPIEQLAGEQ